MTASMFSAYGLILSSDRHRTGLTESAYLGAARRGELVRVRRGAYCESGHWASLSPRERYLLRIRATVVASAHPVVLCGYSAAAVWDMPIRDEWPSDVHVVASPASGGRSKQGVVRHPFFSIGEVEERDGLLVTGVARTALDQVLALDFAPAVASLDWALWRRNALRVRLEDVREELVMLHPRYRRSHADAVIGFATNLSDSFGESMTRAVIHQLGYPAPELQVRFRDRKGAMDVDYFWRAERKVGEFDGQGKYLRPEFDQNLTPGQIVWREKKREDRLRRQCDGVIRIISEDTNNPRQLDLLLRESGLRPSPRPVPPPRGTNFGSAERLSGAMRIGLRETGDGVPGRGRMSRRG
jgi:hypothetical protein